MPNIEQQSAEKLELQKRINTLPENLKKEFLADKNIELVSKICQDYSIPKDKVKYVASVVGEVLLGYTKPEEVASELHDFFEIDLQKSNFIEIELKQKLFDPLKADLAKIYNPVYVDTEEETEVTEQPTVINFEKEAAPISVVSAIPLQRPSVIIQSKSPDAPQRVNPPPTPVPEMEAVPFIIQTKSEAIKPASIQFPKETPSLNLKVDESIIQKNLVIKPVSVRLEAQQPISNARFQMPVSEKQPLPQEIKPKEILIPIQKSPILPAPAPTLKQISEQSFDKAPAVVETLAGKQDKQNPPKVVHYSTFKTPLTPSGVPKKPEPKKEDMINLATFTKVSGNTVDLRSKSSNS